MSCPLRVMSGALSLAAHYSTYVMLTWLLALRSFHDASHGCPEAWQYDKHSVNSSDAFETVTSKVQQHYLLSYGVKYD